MNYAWFSEWVAIIYCNSIKRLDDHWRCIILSDAENECLCFSDSIWALKGVGTILSDCCLLMCGPDSSVGIATDYRLDGSGSNPGGNEIFRPSRPARGPTHPPVKWVPDLSPGVKCGRGVLLTTHPLLVPRPWKTRGIPFTSFVYNKFTSNGLHNKLVPVATRS